MKNNKKVRVRQTPPTSFAYSYQHIMTEVTLLEAARLAHRRKNTRDDHQGPQAGDDPLPHETTKEPPPPIRDPEGPAPTRRNPDLDPPVLRSALPASRYLKLLTPI